MKKGISLITLIITIVVIIILSAAVILSLNNGGVIDSARIASLATDHNNLQTSIELYLTNVVSSNLDMDFDKEKILLGEFDDSYRIVQKSGESLIESIINKDNEEIYVYKLDEELCKAKGIEFPKTPSKDSYWYISKSGQVYLVYSEDATISAWIIGNPPEGKQIESDALDRFVAKIGEWEKEPNIYDIIPVADANMFTYTNATNGTVSITGFNSEYAGIIPSEIKFPTIDPKGNTVVGITNGAFRGKTNLNKIVVTEGITKIEDNAFDGCENLNEVYLPTTLNYIRYSGNSPFSQCTKIEKITIPNYIVGGTYTHPLGIFGDSKGTIKNVEFVGDITSISANAFNGFAALEKITIPNTVTSIGNSAFQNCISLSGKIIIPENVESIGHNAFSGCKSITAVEFLSKGKLASIGNQAFLGLNLITSIKIPEGVTKIDDNAFGNCENLKEVYLPTTLNYIRYSGNSPFSQCTKIEKIAIPNYVVGGTYTNPSGIFGDSKGTIKNVEFVGDITLISASAFNGFAALEKITIPNTVTSIGNSAFQNCISLSGKIIIPENVESIGHNAFSGCKSITAVEFLSKGKLLSIGNQAFLGLNLITSIKIPEGVTKIDDNAFGNCENLKEVYLPTTLNYIRYSGNSPFSQCTKIENITIPNYLASGINTSYPAIVFGDSKGTIKNVEFVGDITSISASAFSGFTALQSITIPNTVTSIGNNAFQNCISLSGKIIIPENVESIGHNAFSGCKYITAVEFLSKGKLASIGNQAFLGLNLITSIKIPEGVTKIDDNAFGNCENLKEVYLPTTLNYIRYSGNSPFSQCTKIEKITIPNYIVGGTYTHPLGIFGDSKGTIKNVEFVGDITSISANAFNGFVALQNITIPNTVNSISSTSFSGCTNLTKIIYSGSATGAPWGATNATVVTE